MAKQEYETLLELKEVSDKTSELVLPALQLFTDLSMLEFMFKEDALDIFPVC